MFSLPKLTDTLFATFDASNAGVSLRSHDALLKASVCVMLGRRSESIWHFVYSKHIDGSLWVKGSGSAQKAYALAFIKQRGIGVIWLAIRHNLYAQHSVGIDPVKASRRRFYRRGYDRQNRRESSGRFGPTRNEPRTSRGRCRKECCKNPISLAHR